MNTQNATAELQAFAAPISTVPDAFIVAIKTSHAITAAAAAVSCALADGSGVTALPEDFKVRDLENYLPFRRRPRGTMATRIIAAFAEYAMAHAGDGATVFVDPADMTATAVLDLGSVESPGHADNKAKLTPNKTADYAALLQITAGPRSQQDVAEFLEDWAGQVLCFNGADEIKAPLAIAAVRKITIESAQRVESEEQSLSATRSAFESIKASSQDPLPTTIYFACQPYADLAERTFVLRLSILTGEKTPKLVLRVQKLDTHAEEMANELVERITDAIGPELPVLVGSYGKAA